MKPKRTPQEIAAELLAMNNEDFYNHFMSGTNAMGRKHLNELLLVLEFVVRKT